MTPCPFAGRVTALCSVLPQDYIDTEMLLCAENVNQDNLLSYAREAADFATNYQLPSLDFAMNHYGQPDVAMFDFTSMYASENAALVRERQSHPLLVALVGDSLLEVRPAPRAPSLLLEDGPRVYVGLAGLSLLAGLCQARAGLRACPFSNSEEPFCLHHRELSRPPRGCSGLTVAGGQTWVAWSGLLGHPSHSSWTLSWAQIPSSCGWVLWPCSAEVLRCRKARGPKASFHPCSKVFPEHRQMLRSLGLINAFRRDPFSSVM